MSDVSTWNLSDEFLLESAEKRFQEGDYFGALSVLNKRNLKYGPGADAEALYADIYEALEIWDRAADAWFRFLDTCNEADFSEGYEGLGIAFMNMGNDMQSAFYYHRAFTEGEDFEEGFGDFFSDDTEGEPYLRVLHAPGERDPEALNEGFELMKAGEFENARKVLTQVEPTSPDYATAMGVAAMCSIMNGDEAGAQRECEDLLRTYPKNIQLLTSYCAALGARGNHRAEKEVAKYLFSLDVEAPEDLFRIATALCETGLHDEAYKTLARVLQFHPYDVNLLYFYAVAAKNSGRVDESIETLERLTLLYPRKAVAQYYLEHLRLMRDGEGGDVPMVYYYRLPPETYHEVADFLLSVVRADDREVRRLASLPRLRDFLHLAFDESEGRDHKLMMLAAKVALRVRADDFLREILLDYEGDDLVKLAVLHELAARNEDDSFGTVLMNIYREFFTHRLDIGECKAMKFMEAFADVYSKYALLDDGNEGKLCAVAEDIYRSLEEADALDYIDERASLAAAIYREARLPGAARGLSEILKIFDADRIITQEILNFMI